MSRSLNSIIGKREGNDKEEQEGTTIKAGNLNCSSWEPELLIGKKAWNILRLKLYSVILKPLFDLINLIQTNHLDVNVYIAIT